MKDSLFSARYLILALAAGAMLAACGGHGNENAAPTIAKISDQMVDQDTPTAALAVAVSEAQTPADQLQVFAATSDPGVVPSAGLALSGSGGSRSLTVTPAIGATGTAQITLVVTDTRGASTSTSFTITVKPVLAQFSTLTTTLYAQDMSATPQRVDNITFTFDVNDNPAAFDALFQ